MLSVKVEQLTTDPNAQLSLGVLAGRAGLARRITVPRIQKPGLALAGYTEQVHPERVQILGATEMGYLDRLGQAERTAGLGTLVGLESGLRGDPAGSSRRWRCCRCARTRAWRCCTARS